MAPNLRQFGADAALLLNPIDDTAFQQALDVLAREAQGLPDPHSAERAVLDEPVHRRGVHLQVSCQVLDCEQRLKSQLYPSTPQEVKTLAAQLRSLGSSIDNLRSDKSTAHGKAPGEYVVDDSLWAETVVNASATLGIFLWKLYERHTVRKAESSGQVPVYCGDTSF